MAGRPSLTRDPEGEAVRADMARGVAIANKFWDSHIRFITSRAILVGFLIRLFAFYAASSTPLETMTLFESVKRGIEGLEIMKQPKGGH
jgi:hypothetical protein